MACRSFGFEFQFSSCLLCYLCPLFASQLFNFQLKPKKKNQFFMHIIIKSFVEWIPISFFFLLFYFIAITIENGFLFDCTFIWKSFIYVHDCCLVFYSSGNSIKALNRWEYLQQKRKVFFFFSPFWTSFFFLEKMGLINELKSQFTYWHVIQNWFKAPCCVLM